MEIVPPSVLTDGDSFPLSQDQIEAAIRDFPKETHKAAVILAQPEAASPLLRKAYNSASDTDKLSYALILAVLGDSCGVDTLTAELEAHTAWDAGWRYTGMGQFGGALSPIDRTIVALGRTRNPRAIDPILRKAKQLTPDSEFSHHRAVALALESIGDRRAASALAELLAQPGVQGHVISDVQQAAKASGLNVNETHTRGFSLRELSLARALYRCGDQDGLGKAILEKYAKDLRGHWSKHAQTVLDDARAKVK
jgi:HEAT repeat protein